jgi:hypothetical protein
MIIIYSRLNAEKKMVYSISHDTEGNTFFWESEYLDDALVEATRWNDLFNDTGVVVLSLTNKFNDIKVFDCDIKVTKVHIDYFGEIEGFSWEPFDHDIQFSDMSFEALVNIINSGRVNVFVDTGGGYFVPLQVADDGRVGIKILDTIVGVGALIGEYYNDEKVRESIVMDEG